jgi:hypothetical protein
MPQQPTVALTTEELTTLETFVHQGTLLLKQETLPSS